LNSNVIHLLLFSFKALILVFLILVPWIEITYLTSNFTGSIRKRFRLLSTAIYGSREEPRKPDLNSLRWTAPLQKRNIA
jgi:hypothetical protein